MPASQTGDGLGLSRRCPRLLCRSYGTDSDVEWRRIFQCARKETGAIRTITERGSWEKCALRTSLLRIGLGYWDGAGFIPGTHWTWMSHRRWISHRRHSRIHYEFKARVFSAKGTRVGTKRESMLLICCCLQPKIDIYLEAPLPQYVDGLRRGTQVRHCLCCYYC